MTLARVALAAQHVSLLNTCGTGSVDSCGAAAPCLRARPRDETGGPCGARCVGARDRAATRHARLAFSPEASMTRLDDLPRPNSPQRAPGYNSGNPGVALQDRPARRQEDVENELYWHRPSVGQSADGRRPQRQGRQVNVGDSERAVSVAAGAIVGLLGLSRGSLPGLLGAAVGGAMVYRGVTGTCPMYRAMDVDTTEPGQGEAEGLESLHNGVHITTAFGVRKPAEALYGFWRDFENLPRIMTHLESVRVIDDRRSHWVARANSLGGKRFEWDA